MKELCVICLYVRAELPRVCLKSGEIWFALDRDSLGAVQSSIWVWSRETRGHTWRDEHMFGT